jgi:tRNA (mo5U34)-methyltransferase
MGTPIKDAVEALTWVHKIDLGNGIVTPGRWPFSNLNRRAFDHIDFAGKRVLDVGCWDGLWSFEAEKRGAQEVFATDDISQRSFHSTQTFNLAKNILQSNVQYFPGTPIDRLPGLGIKFDIILFLGVYYHLRDPLRALGILRGMLRDGGLIVVEGQVIYNRRRSFARFLYNNIYFDDVSNWWIPSIKCLEEWVESSFFRKNFIYLYNEGILNKTSRFAYVGRRTIGTLVPRRNTGRAVIVAEAVSRKDPRWGFPDPLFVGIDGNTYD